MQFTTFNVEGDPMAPENWTILFDLDQTLILTSALASLRNARAWSRVYEQFHLTNLPPGTLEFLSQVRSFAQLGIVTNTPRPYAEKLVAYHRLPIPIVVAYHDTRMHKPHPEPLLTAMSRLRCSVKRCCYIGDRSDDLQAALNAKVIPIGLSWDNSLDSSWATALSRPLCSNWDDVFVTLQQLTLMKEV